MQPKTAFADSVLDMIKFGQEIMLKLGSDWDKDCENLFADVTP